MESKLDAIIHLFIGFALFTIFIFFLLSFLLIFISYALFLVRESKKGSSALAAGIRAFRFLAVKKAGGNLTIFRIFLTSSVLAALSILLIKIFGYP